jgi:hypothetical protein
MIKEVRRANPTGRKGVVGASRAWVNRNVKPTKTDGTVLLICRGSFCQEEFLCVGRIKKDGPGKSEAVEIVSK